MARKNGWLWFGFAATFFYFLLVGLFNQYESDLIRDFPKLPLNEKGDALAGFFAPLAFLWLFVATMIQSQELAAQRLEIEENRKVMQEQANAAQDQASFLKAQTDAMGAQTLLLTRQVAITERTAERGHKLALFEKRIETYNALISFGARDWSSMLFSEPDEDHLLEIANKAEFLFDDEIVSWIKSIMETIDYIGVETRKVNREERNREVGGPSYRKQISDEDLRDIKNHRDDAIGWFYEQLSDFVLKSKLGHYLTLYEPETQV
ncbi:hypothetical protein ASC97_12455 [Rhizobium sp. Root1203]|uniref:hypothetical protein n=1 Tax=Rhizobium sp. Root1203 TaxID=1736427 RepID=UPI0007102418|nr:hypothetical protein [Rhizobium sp. Root1203]KQV14014.1 hypothetical protein ASC97_12455 [Rhizobium sp. Root1203]